MKAYFGDGRDWYFQQRLGMFVHWGLYAIEGWHEQALWRQRRTRADYRPLAEQWNPHSFEPDRWLDLAQEAGMDYIVLTTKHHDGFCLFDSDLTDFKVTRTPYGKDIVAQLAEACQRRRIKLGLYYSVVDWMHPKYPNQGRHHELPPQPEDSPELDAYMEYLRGQVRELCTRYGELCCFWWDMNVEKNSDLSINAMIRELQPTCVINNRGMDDGDFGTPERDWDDHNGAAGQPVEACQSVGMQSWGYRTNESYYSQRHLIRSAHRFLCSGANYLLNVGPDAEGVIPERSVRIVRALGDWWRKVGTGIRDTNPVAGLPEADGIAGSRITSRGNKLFVHLPGDFLGDDVSLKPLKKLPRRAVLLNTGQELRCATDMLPWHHDDQTGYLRVCGLPVDELAGTSAVIELEFSSEQDFADASRVDAAGSEINIR